MSLEAGLVGLSAAWRSGRCAWMIDAAVMADEKVRPRTYERMREICLSLLRGLKARDASPNAAVIRLDQKRYCSPILAPWRVKLLPFAFASFEL